MAKGKHVDAKKLALSLDKWMEMNDKLIGFEMVGSIMPKIKITVKEEAIESFKLTEAFYAELEGALKDTFGIEGVSYDTDKIHFWHDNIK